MFSLGKIIENVTGLGDKIGQMGVNKTDGSNQAVLEIQKILKEIKENAEGLERAGEQIIKIVQKNWSKFDKRDQKQLDKHISNFDKYD